MRVSIIRLFLMSALGGATFVGAGCSGDDGQQGPAGPEGPEGPAGPEGPEGTQGPAGSEGAMGEMGAMGVRGPRGPVGAMGEMGEMGEPGVPGSSGDPMIPGLTRLATVPLGSEVPGLELGPDGDFFFNVQHPDDGNTIGDVDGRVFDKGSVGAVVGLDLNQLPRVFAGVGVPSTQEEKETVQVAVGEYQVLGQEGDDFDGTILGAMLDPEGNTVKLSNDPDFNSWIQTQSGEGHLFSNWEDRPGGVSRMKLTKNAEGRWDIDEAMMVDFSDVHGTWVNCFGSTSPWNTPLTSEENYASYQTQEWNNPASGLFGQVNDLADHLGLDTENDEWPNPYRYGYIVEIEDPESAATPIKHYTMGRFAHENSVVMPDQRTVYLTDDGTGGMFFKFVADAAGDLSSGTLYAAKVVQDDARDPAVAGFDVQWIELGSSDDATIEGWIADYDEIGPDDYTDGQTSYITQADVDEWANGNADDDRVAFLESRAAGLALGATAEWRKKEGINISQARAEEAVDGTDLVPGETVEQAYVYMAMSNINATMTDDEGDIQLNGRVDECGAIYRMPLKADYDVSRIEPALIGGPYNESRGDNACNLNNISEPDNVYVMDDGRVIIGEDTGEHVNNMVWVWDPDASF